MKKQVHHVRSRVLADDIMSMCIDFCAADATFTRNVRLLYTILYLYKYSYEYIDRDIFVLI